MSFSLTTVKTQVIALLNLSVRDSSGTPTYSTSLGDNTYSDGELTRACQSAATRIMKAICETDGHAHRSLFTASTALTHAAVLPAHLGTPGVPRITPFSGATDIIVGKRKSVEEIAAYRANINNRYSLTAHNVVSPTGGPSKLAGFYAIDVAINVVYFTGYSAVADLANFQESDFTLLPDVYYPTAIDLAIGDLKKDGDSSDVFSTYQAKGDEGLAMIRANGVDQPSLKKTVGTRDSGAK